MPVVTVDFHNTLIECESWFDLEIRTLVSAVLEWSRQYYQPNVAAFDPEQLDQVYRRLRRAIHGHGHELDAERSVAVVLDRFGLQLPEQVVREAIEELMRESLAHSAPVAGAPKFLRDLSDAGTRIAIVSSAVYHPFLEWALETHNLRRYIDVVITSASSGFYKSRPEIFWAALDALGHARNGAAHIGDSLRFDVGGAASAGMRTVWFDRRREGWSEGSLREPQPDLIVTDLDAAAAAVSRLASSRDA